jgi:hypothetical protein
MDQDIEELKQEVEELKAMTEDTNRQVHKMRRAAWWGRAWAIIWWLLVFGVSGAAYYYYAQPVIQRVEQYYESFQHQSGQAQNWGSELGQLFAGYFSGASTTKSN